MKIFSILSYLSYLSYLGGGPVFAQENLLVTSHTIQINQGLREEETFYFGISEEVEIENRGFVPFEENLEFWVGEGEDLRIEAEGQTLEFSLKEGVATAKLSKSLEPNKGVRVTLDYKVFFVEEGKEAQFTKKILYPHKEKSFQIKVNPVENLGFFPQANFSFQRSEKESGWFVSPFLSPKAGDLYTVKVIKGERPSPLPLPKEESRQKPSPSPTEERRVEEKKPIVVPEKIKEGLKEGKSWLKKYRILLINDAFVLLLVFLLFFPQKAKRLLKTLLFVLRRATRLFFSVGLKLQKSFQPKPKRRRGGKRRKRKR